MDRVFAGIVSFNPDVDKLRQNLDAIVSQVDKVVIFENGSKEQQLILACFPNIKFLKSSDNIGIASALNCLIEWGKENGYQWMLSLDQDSVCPTNFVIDMMPYLSVTENIGIVAPVIIDRNIGIVGHDPTNCWSEVRTCITSGAFNNIIAWDKIGGYDESMFIDSVDFEYCYRLRKNGFKVIQISGVMLSHELGNSQKRRFLFWRVIVHGHSAFRKYYIARNNVYYPLKHHLWFRFIRGNLRNLWLLMVVTLYEGDKRAKCKAICKGWKDGVKAKK